MELHSSKEKNIMVDIEIGESTMKSEQILGKRKVKKSFKKLVSGILNIKGDSTGAVKPEKGQTSGGEVTGRMDGKLKKTAKPPRHPKAPLLDAGDMRFVKEIAKVATKKRERMVQAKASKKMKATKSSSDSSPSTPPACTSSTISAMVITVVFFVVIICQGLGSKNTSLNAMLLPLPRPGAPQPSPEQTTGSA